MVRRFLSILLIIVLLLTAVPLTVSAEEVDYPLFEGTLRISDEGIEMIKDLEGFIKTPTWDVAQHSVGYGCSTDYAQKYGFDPSGMTKEEDHQLMLFVLDEMEESLDKFLSSHNIEVNQYQYDALMSFTYNLGKGSINATSRIGKLLKEGAYTVNQMASAFGIYCHTGTGKKAVVQDHLVSRRIREAKLFLYGAYDFEDVPEKFCRLTYAGNVPSSYSDVALYLQGSPYQILFDADPNSDYAYGGRYFVGWYTENGVKLTADTLVEDNLTVYPMWSDWEEDVELKLEQDPYVCANWKQLTEKTYVKGVVEGTTPAGPDNNGSTETPPENYVEASERFTDVTQDQWYYSYVNDLVNSGVINGYEDNTFRPDRKVTTGEALKMILLAAEYPVPEQVTEHWASGYHYQALDWGIIERGDIVDLDVEISRSMMAKITANALGLERLYDTDPYSDSQNLYACILHDYGITQGYEDGTFRPDRSLTRAELSTIVWRIQSVF